MTMAIDFINEVSAEWSDLIFKLNYAKKRPKDKRDGRSTASGSNLDDKKPSKFKSSAIDHRIVMTTMRSPINRENSDQDGDDNSHTSKSFLYHRFYYR